MKNIFRATLAVVAVAAVGVGSYKAYNSYMAANMSEEDILLAENIEALALDSDAGSPKTKKILVPNKSGSCWNSIQGNAKPVYNSQGRFVRWSYYYSSNPTGSTWQTCKKQKTEDLNATDQCTSKDCPSGEYTEKQAEGWF